MTSYFIIEMNNSEVQTLFRNGSTAQKQFIKQAEENHAVSEVFQLLESLIHDEILTGINGEPYNLRGEINGGVLKLINLEDKKELSENDFLIYEIKENLFLCIE